MVVGSFRHVLLPRSGWLRRWRLASTRQRGIGGPRASASSRFQDRPITHLEKRRPIKETGPAHIFIRPYFLPNGVVIRGPYATLARSHLLSSQFSLALLFPVPVADFVMQMLRRKLLEAFRRLPLYATAAATSQRRAHAVAALSAPLRAPSTGSLAAAPWAATQRRGAKMLGSDVRIPW
jgi:hypothetical protein